MVLQDAASHSYSKTTGSTGKFTFTSTAASPITPGILEIGAGKTGYKTVPLTRRWLPADPGRPARRDATEADGYPVSHGRRCGDAGRVGQRGPDRHHVGLGQRAGERRGSDPATSGASTGSTQDPGLAAGIGQR